jgi:transposase
VRRLERKKERLEREKEKLREKLTERGKKPGEAEKQIADLERQSALQKRNSTTSSKPPSSDGLAGEQRERGSSRKKSCRKRGGQPGHPGHWRKPVPEERINQVVEVLPEQCIHCEKPLPRDVATGRGPGLRHQATELPTIQPQITEYRCHRSGGPECGKETQAPLPPEAGGDFGPNLAALIAHLTVVCRMPRRGGWRCWNRSWVSISVWEVSKAAGRRWARLWLNPAGNLKSNSRTSRSSTAMKQDTGQTVRNAGYGRSWLPSLLSIKVALTRGAEVLVQLPGSVFAGTL